VDAVSRARGWPPSAGPNPAKERPTCGRRDAEHGAAPVGGVPELEDEQITDHLQQVFESADMTGNDGQVHLEGESLACLCGFSAATTKELDAHLLKGLTPYDAIGRDGDRHEIICGH